MNSRPYLKCFLKTGRRFRKYVKAKECLTLSYLSIHCAYETTFLNSLILVSVHLLLLREIVTTVSTFIGASVDLIIREVNFNFPGSCV